MSSTHLLHHQHHHSHHQDQSPPPLPPVQRPLTYQEQQQQHHYHRSPLISSHSTASSDRISGPSAQLQSFAEDRKNGVPLPRVGGAAIVGEDSIVSSRNSSPYTSPHIAPRPRAPIAAAVESTMEEVTLPPIQAAVPMRRGAVSGASSGPSLPFPPIRPPFEDDDMPSRGPSPTLGKRGSFSMGHSNHVPPGPEVQLPTPVLSGSGERRGTIISIPSFSSSSLHHHSEGSTLDVPRSSIARLADDSNYYAPPASSTPQRYGATDGVIPWSSQYKPSRSGSVDPSSGPPPLPPYHSSPSSYVPGGAVASSASSHRIGHFNDDTHRQYSYSRPSPLVSQPYTYAPEPRTVSSNYRLEYQRDASEMSPGSNSSAMHVDSSLSPRMKQSHLMHHEDPYGHSHSRSSVSSHHHHPYQHHTQSHLVAPHESETSINGKRPRSAPRVMSSQPRIFACTQCPARFARNHDLKRHQRGHLSVRPYPCNWCGKSFSRKDALKRHILVKVSLNNS